MSAVLLESLGRDFVANQNRKRFWEETIDKLGLKKFYRAEIRWMDGIQTVWLVEIKPVPRDSDLMDRLGRLLGRYLREAPIK